jgi:hypothetical protein
MDEEKAAAAAAAASGATRRLTRASTMDVVPLESGRAGAHAAPVMYQPNAWQRQYKPGDAVCDACLGDPPCKTCLCTPKLDSTFCPRVLPEALRGSRPMTFSGNGICSLCHDSRNVAKRATLFAQAVRAQRLLEWNHESYTATGPGTATATGSTAVPGNVYYTAGIFQGLYVKIYGTVDVVGTGMIGTYTIYIILGEETSTPEQSCLT